MSILEDLEHDWMGQTLTKLSRTDEEQQLKSVGYICMNANLSTYLWNHFEIANLNQEKLKYKYYIIDS